MTSPLSLLVASPSLRATVHVPHLQGCLGVQDYCHRHGHGFGYRAQSGISVIAHARNLLAGHFLAETKHSHMLFVDDDIGFDGNVVGGLLEWHETDVIAVMCPKRRFDWERIKQIVLAHPDIEASALPHLTGDYIGMFALVEDAPMMAIGAAPIPVEAIGTGVMMISRACLERLITAADMTPYYDRAHGDFPIYDFFPTSLAGGKFTGEDIGFCNLVRRHAGTILGCPWPVVTHSGNYDYVGDLKGIARYI
jgi:hypothetical protein